MTRATWIKRFLTICSVGVFLLMTACGGDEEPPPPHQPSEAEAEALKKFHAAAANFNRTLLGGGNAELSHKDQFMNALLMYLTSDGGRKSDQSIAYLIWYVKNVVKSSIPNFGAAPKPIQRNALFQLGRLYRSILADNNNPNVTAAIDAARTTTQFEQYLRGG